MSIEIEKGIPIPSRKTGRKPGSSKYPFDSMEVWDSFCASTSRASLASAARRWAKHNNPKAKFTTKVDVHGTRIWRTA